LEPLPQRVRQANLAAELRGSRGEVDEAAPVDAEVEPADLLAARSGRSGAAIGAFQRQSRRARQAADDGPALARPAPGSEQTKEEGGR
jgi:hypothetical protein